jgi:hypothetical protein
MAEGHNSLADVGTGANGMKILNRTWKNKRVVVGCGRAFAQKEKKEKKEEKKEKNQK